MVEGFTTSRVATAGAKIHLRQGGSGPPRLLLHGYPETSMMWHKIATAAIWCDKALEVTGRALPCGHFLPEAAPEETLAALEAFLEG